MAAMVSSQSNASTDDDWRIQFEEIMRRMGSMEKSTIDPIDLSSKGAASRKESKGRTLLLKIHLLRYSISWEELDCLFARFGRIECIEVFCPGEQYHSRIRFQQKDSAIRAIESFNHRNIYDGCCRMELILEAEIDDGFQEPRNRTQSLLHISEQRSTTTSSSESWERRMRMQENLRIMEALVKKLHMEPCQSIAQASTEEDSVEESLLDEESEIEINPIEESIQKIDLSPHFIEEINKPEICINSSMSPTSLNLEGEKSKVFEVPEDTVMADLKMDDSKEPERIPKASPIKVPENPKPAPHTQPNQVASNPCSALIFYSPFKGLGELVVLLIELIEIRMANWRNDSIECLKTPSAHKVFVKMPSRGFHLTMGLLVCSDRHSCKPISFDLEDELKQNSITLPYDRGKETYVAWAWMITIDARVGVCDTKRERSNVGSFSPGRYPVVFDPGGFDALPVSKKDELNRRMISWLDLSSSIMSIKGGHMLLDEDLIFDPGGVLCKGTVGMLVQLEFAAEEL